jgi:hypothetical protein
MFRRFVSLLVIAGMFASQLAAIPHAHGEMSREEQQKHSATPHVHVFGHCQHCHSHCHSNGHSHHHENEPESGPPQPAGDGYNHDSTTIYLGDSANLATTVGIASVTPTTVLDLPSSFAPTTFGFDGSNVPALPWHPPDEVADDSEIYLTLRTLRN